MASSFLKIIISLCKEEKNEDFTSVCFDLYLSLQMISMYGILWKYSLQMIYFDCCWERVCVMFLRNVEMAFLAPVYNIEIHMSTRGGIVAN